MHIFQSQFKILNKYILLGVKLNVKKLININLNFNICNICNINIIIHITL